MRGLSIYWWQGSSKVKIGEIEEAPGSPIVFEWDPAFLSTSVELSPLRFQKVPGLIECPKEPFNGLPGLLADCIPDGWGRLLLKIGLDRKGITTDQLSPLDAMAYIGDRAMGALSFEPKLDVPGAWGEGAFSLKELEKGVGPILEGRASSVMDAFLENGASPNGLRPKILLKEHEGGFCSINSPVEGDEWLIKFKAPEDPVGIGKLEYIYALMARTAGLDMPQTRLFESEGREFFGVKRFDRSGIGRLHVHTLSGMLHASPGNFSVGYDHFAKVAQHLTRDIREVEKVVRLAAFNVIASNQDDHSKNVAFLMENDGTWKVAPAYDLTFHRTRYSEHKMLLGEKGQPGVKDLSEFGVRFGLTKNRTTTIINQVMESISRFKDLSSEYELPRPLLSKMLPVLEQTLRQTKG